MPYNFQHCSVSYSSLVLQSRVVWTHYVTQIDLKLMPLCQPPSAGIMGLRHHTQLHYFIEFLQMSLCCHSPVSFLMWFLLFIVSVSLSEEFWLFFQNQASITVPAQYHLWSLMDLFVHILY